jgi:F0F1-type ATP synthase delta subunit
MFKLSKGTNGHISLTILDSDSHFLMNDSAYQRKKWFRLQSFIKQGTDPANTLETVLQNLVSKKSYRSNFLILLVKSKGIFVTEHARTPFRKLFLRRTQTGTSIPEPFFPASV